MNYFLILPDEILSLILVTLNKKQLIKFLKIYPSFQLNEKLWSNMLFNKFNKYNKIFKDKEYTTYYTRYLLAFPVKIYTSILYCHGKISSDAYSNDIERTDRNKNNLIRTNSKLIMDQIITELADNLGNLIEFPPLKGHYTSEDYMSEIKKSPIFKFIFDNNYTLENFSEFSSLAFLLYNDDYKNTQEQYSIEYKKLQLLCQEFIIINLNEIKNNNTLKDKFLVYEGYHLEITSRYL